MTERPDLDGACVREPGDMHIWLVFNGKRHRVTSYETFQRLFLEDVEVLDFYGVTEIDEGEEIAEGASLIQGEGMHDIYLLNVAGDGGVTGRHILNFESFCDFGFDMEKRRFVPALLIEGLRKEEPLTSATDRASRGS